MDTDVKLVQAGVVRRALARMVDMTIFITAALIGGFVLILIIENLSPNNFLLIAADILFFIIACILLLFGGLLLESLCYRCFGFTPGKRLFGLTVVDLTGKPVSHQQYRRRLWQIYLHAFGLFLPIISNLFLIREGLRASEQGATMYDAGRYQVLFDGWSTAKRNIAILLFVLFHGLYICMLLFNTFITLVRNTTM